MRPRWINRGPKSLFLWLSVCTIIRGKELRELSTAQLSQSVFFLNWIPTITLRKCIWRTMPSACGVLQQCRRAEAARMVSSFMSWNTNSFRSTHLCGTYGFPPGIRTCSPFISSASGGRWWKVAGGCNGKSQDGGPPDLALTTPPHGASVSLPIEWG